MRNMDSGIWWSADFEPFYGPEYCQWTNMDIQRLHEGEFRGNSFRFQEGWVVPTVELLRRLSRLGLLIRTRNHVLVHLCKPVDAMAPGEFYFQVGHQLPGRFSLKFTRCHFDSTIKICQTVLELEEERQLAFNPARFTDALREKAYRNTPTDRILSTVILLDLQTGAIKRENWAKFLQSLHEPINFAPPMCIQDGRYNSLPCTRPPENRERRSGSDGNIPNPRLRVPSIAVEPVENDENDEKVLPRPQLTKTTRPVSITTEDYTGVASAISGVENVAEKSKYWDVTCPAGSTGIEYPWTSLKEDYTGVKEGLEDPYRNQMPFRSEAAAQVSPVRRTSYKDEYTGVTEAMTSLSVRDMPRKMSGELPIMEEYTSTDQGVSARDLPSWTSHQPPIRDSSYLPISVEEVNRMRNQNRRC